MCACGKDISRMFSAGYLEDTELARSTFGLIGRSEKKYCGFQISFAELGIAMYIHPKLFPT